LFLSSATDEQGVAENHKSIEVVCDDSTGFGASGFDF
jgi:hypothetical protein